MKFQGAGKIYLANRISDKPGPFNFVGCADVLNVALTIESFEHIERCSGNNGVDYRGTKKKSGEVTLDLTEFHTKNLQLALNGNAVDDEETPETVTDEAFEPVVAGQMIVLGGADPHDGITALVVTSAGSPGGVLTEDEDYILDADYGTVEFLVDVPGGGTLDYGYQSKSYVSMFTAGTQELWLRYNYINVANPDPVAKKGIVDLYKVRFDPTSSLELINDELQVLSMTGSILVDQSKPDSGDLGQFGRITD